jgi:hypothetical protein
MNLDRLEDERGSGVALTCDFDEFGRSECLQIAFVHSARICRSPVCNDVQAQASSIVAGCTSLLCQLWHARRHGPGHGSLHFENPALTSPYTACPSSNQAPTA